MKPLQGVTVLDFSTLLPGPMATLLLAEAGARVIKIEPPAGEGMRHHAPLWGDDSAMFAMLNRGKESLALDLKDAPTRDKVLELAKTADVVVEQFRPGVMDRLGLGYEALTKINPRIIYCSITGYGQTGPRMLDAGHDLNYAGDAGLLALSFGDVERPVQPPTPLGDIGGGAYPAMINILLAIEQRRTTGRGLHIDISMAENIFPFAYWALATGFASGQWPGNQTHLVTGATPMYRLYATRDKKALIVASLEPKFWATFCEVIDLPAPLRNRDADPAATMAEIERIIASQDSTVWVQRFEGKDCCVSLMKNMEDAVRDPHFKARGVFAAQVKNEKGEEITALPVPIVAALRVAPDSAVASPALGSGNAALVGEKS